MSEREQVKKAIDAEIEQLAMTPWNLGYKTRDVNAWAAVKANVAIGDMFRSAKK